MVFPRARMGWGWCCDLWEQIEGDMWDGIVVFIMMVDVVVFLVIISLWRGVLRKAVISAEDVVGTVVIILVSDLLFTMLRSVGRGDVSIFTTGSGCIDVVMILLVIINHILFQA